MRRLRYDERSRRRQVDADARGRPGLSSRSCRIAASASRSRSSRPTPASSTTKLGTYGIGFVSVFAIEPERVDVRTRTANEAWVVRLFGDHSFELATDAQRPGTGTEVILLHTMTAEELVEMLRDA